MALAAGCVARGEGKLVHQTDDDAGPPGPTLIDGGNQADAKFDIPPTDPHAVLGVDPPHGPFVGGQQAIVRGNGFGSDVRIWFGDVEVPADDVIAIDPGRAQVIVPEGTAGPVTVVAQNGVDESTRGELPGGYTYDAFYAEPSSGPTSGGTLITLHGQGTAWDGDTKVLVDLTECSIQEVAGPTELRCSTPQGTPGAKPVRITTSDDVSVDVLDAFTYGDSDNGFRGGLSGQPLGSQLTVLVLNGFTGDVIPGATVIAGDDFVKTTDSAGIAVFQSPDLGPKRSVTVARDCFQPITFVDVPVDTVTAYVDPVLSPACVDEGDPPPVGGTPGLGSTMSGQLVWPGGVEFKRAEWTNVPNPSSPDEEQVAYVFTLTSDPTREFRLPTPTTAVTTSSPGSIGYEFDLSGTVGNLTLYALAGIENRAASPPTFVAYAMGLIQGVATQPGKKTSDIFIPMDVPLDHAITMTVDGPKPTSKGPDRVRTSVAIRVGKEGYAILPAGQRIELLPVGSPLQFVGIPPLVGSIAGTDYVSTASAFTGDSQALPKSVIGLLASTTTNQIIPLDNFVEIPKLEVPGTNGSWNGQDLATSWEPGGASVDLTVYEIESGGGLVTWSIAAPAGVQSIRLPDLTQVPGASLKKGAISVSVSAAHIEDFVYGELVYRQLGARGWDAYAQDVYFAHY